MTWGSDESGDPDAIGAEEKARELASLKELVNLNEELRRVEKETALSSFYGEGYTEAELGAKPMVLVIGQYSTGKTTLISSLCGGDYDGARVAAPSHRRSCARVRRVRRDLLCSPWSIRREETTRPKMSRIDVDSTGIERFEVRSGPPTPVVDLGTGTSAPSRRRRSSSPSSARRATRCRRASAATTCR